MSVIMDLIISSLSSYSEIKYFDEKLGINYCNK